MKMICVNTQGAQGKLTIGKEYSIGEVDGAYGRDSVICRSDDLGMKSVMSRAHFAPASQVNNANHVVFSEESVQVDEYICSLAKTSLNQVLSLVFNLKENIDKIRVEKSKVELLLQKTKGKLNEVSINLKSASRELDKTKEAVRKRDAEISKIKNEVDHLLYDLEREVECKVSCYEKLEKVEDNLAVMRRKEAAQRGLVTRLRRKYGEI